MNYYDTFYLNIYLFNALKYNTIFYQNCVTDIIVKGEPFIYNNSITSKSC